MIIQYKTWTVCKYFNLFTIKQHDRCHTCSRIFLPFQNTSDDTQWRVLFCRLLVGNFRLSLNCKNTLVPLIISLTRVLRTEYVMYVLLIAIDIFCIAVLNFTCVYIVVLVCNDHLSLHNDKIFNMFTLVWLIIYLFRSVLRNNTIDTTESHNFVMKTQSKKNLFLYDSKYNCLNW